MDAIQTPISRPMTPLSPETPIIHSLHIATSTMDELTLALTNYSRVPSPDPPSALAMACCCHKEDCPNLTAWIAIKSKLEHRLILSAEVGQALLQRHEAYVRQHEARAMHRRMKLERHTQRGSVDHPLRHELQLSQDEQQKEEDEEEQRTQEDIDTELDELYRENQNLKKQLNQALVNNEVTEVSNKTILHELQEARSTISRLSAQHARSIGWDARLSVAMKEKDDMQQERDSESQRARIAETRFAALRDKTGKLQVEVRRLQEALEEKRTHRWESSESILQDARSRLEGWQQKIGRHDPLVPDSELTKVLESLVTDNEALKRDNAELQTLLSDAREEIHTLQEEVDEQRANAAFQLGVGLASPIARHLHVGSVPSLTLREPTLRSFEPRSVSAERSRKRGIEPLTPETAHQTLPSLSPTHVKGSSTSRPPSHYSPYNLSLEIDPELEFNDDATPAQPSRAPKTLLLLRRSRSVQTDPPAPAATSTSSPSPIPSHLSVPSPPDLYSEVSSFSEGSSSDLSVILDRASALLTRMIQADPLTLTHRLKRQNLKGADLSHLSRTTINSINNEIKGLRLQFRSLLEDDKLVTSCTRKDLRLLFKFLGGVFGEMGKMKMTLNDVIIDPSCAQRVSMAAMEKGNSEFRDRSVANTPGLPAIPPFKGPVSVSWITPISKLFGAGSTNPYSERSLAKGGISPQSDESEHIGRKPTTKIVPKIPAALAATATTVNVEFSGVGRSTTSATSPGPAPKSAPASGKSKDGVMGQSVASSPTSTTFNQPTSSSSVMDIFAGAPKPMNTTGEPWVMISPVTPRVSHLRYGTEPHYTLHPNTPSSPIATVGRGGYMRIDTLMPRLSRNVEAVIDVAASPVLIQQQHVSPRQRKESLLGPRGQVVVGESHPEMTIAGDHDDGNRQNLNHGQEHDESEDAVTPLVSGRTLRRRGLSESSIHSTFLSQAITAGGTPGQDVTEGGVLSPTPKSKSKAGVVTTAGGGDGRFFMNWPDGQSVFQALTKRMQNFRVTTPTTATVPTASRLTLASGRGSTSTIQPRPSAAPPPAPSMGSKSLVASTAASISSKVNADDNTTRSVSPLAESTNVGHGPPTSLAIPVPASGKRRGTSKGRRSMAASPSSQLLSTSPNTINRASGTRNANTRTGGNTHNSGDSDSSGSTAGGGGLSGLLSNWTTAGRMIDSDSGAAVDPFLAGSVRDEQFMHFQRTRRSQESYERDYL